MPVITRITMKIIIFFSPGTNHFPPTGMGTVAGCTWQVIIGPSLSNYHQFIFLQKRSQCIFKMQHRDETPLFTFKMPHFLTGGGLFFPWQRESPTTVMFGDIRSETTLLIWDPTNCILLAIDLISKDSPMHCITLPCWPEPQVLLQAPHCATFG